MAAITKNSTFDPYTQNITILMADGVTPLQVSIADIDESALYNVQVSINVAAQFGASLIMLIVVLLLTKSAKRKSPLFMVNVLSLALSTIRALLAALYFTSAWTELYAEFSGDYSAIPRSAYTNSIAAIVMSLLLLCTIEISLIIQTKVVCTTLKDSYKFAVLAVSVLIALLAVAFRFAFTVENAITILDAESSIDTVWLYSASLITETISIWYFSAIFVAKLGYTLFQRRKLGLRQWGPMQIVCIMGGCTLIIPSIFAILQYFPDNTFPEAGSVAITLVAIFLPLSSIWAAASIDGDAPISRWNYASNGSTYYGTNHSTLYTDHTASAVDRKGSLGPLTPASAASHVEHQPADAFASVITKGRMIGDCPGDFDRMGVRVDKSFSVRTGTLTG